MADDQAGIDDFLSDEPTKKKESIMPFLAALGLISVVAVGAGWIVNSQLAGSQDTVATEDVASTKPGEEPANKGDKPGSKYIVGDASQIVKLDPVLVTMRDSNNTFLRMELALVLNEDSSFANEQARLRIGSEIAAFAQNLSLVDISGPSGYLHLRDDLLDRARLATAGEVREVLILSMVSE